MRGFNTGNRIERGSQPDIELGLNTDLAAGQNSVQSWNISIFIYLYYSVVIFTTPSLFQ